MTMFVGGLISAIGLLICADANIIYVAFLSFGLINGVYYTIILDTLSELSNIV